MKVKKKNSNTSFPASYCLGGVSSRPGENRETNHSSSKRMLPKREKEKVLNGEKLDFCLVLHSLPVFIAEPEFRCSCCIVNFPNRKYMSRTDGILLHKIFYL